MDGKAIQINFAALRISPSRRLLPDYLPVLPPGLASQCRQYETIKEIYQNCERLRTIKEVNV
jgi:hypothetical protein